MLDTEKMQVVDFLAELVGVIESRVSYFQEHGAAVARWADGIAGEMNLPPETRTTLTQAAKLHDLGVAAISDLIMGKATDLTAEEREIMHLHPIVGAKLVERLDWLRDCVPLIRHHHERSDGLGYPDGWTEEQLDLPTRVLILAQAYDAMISPRPYRAGLTPAEAVEELKRNAGSQFSPPVVEAMLAALARGEATK
jgi:HD-GYP domain-containing protein (c-di-GMP phosphodiesterase class II)